MKNDLEEVHKKIQNLLKDIRNNHGIIIEKIEPQWLVQMDGTSHLIHVSVETKSIAR